MEPSPKSPGICWERLLCLPFLGRQERGGWRGSPDPFQASSSTPPVLCDGNTKGRRPPASAEHWEHGAGREGVPRGTRLCSAMSARNICMSGIYLSTAELVSANPAVRRIYPEFVPLCGARCHVEPGRAVQRVLPSPAHTDTRTRTHRPVPSRSWSPWPPPGSAWHGGTAGIK